MKRNEGYRREGKKFKESKIKRQQGEERIQQTFREHREVTKERKKKR